MAFEPLDRFIQTRDFLTLHARVSREGYTTSCMGTMESTIKLCTDALYTESRKQSGALELIWRPVIRGCELN